MNDPASTSTVLPRRDFLKLSSVVLGGLAFTGMPAMAGPFTRADFERLVPADKKLSADWVKSLFDRGARAVYRDRELERIGMPVGGIGCGQVYLGGDGRLWHWDIFNQHVGTGAEHYANPMKPKSPFEQGFALKITTGGQPQIRALERSGWRDITFNGEYPLAFVEYRDPAVPVSVTLEAGSPFVPLEVDDSSYPATAMHFAVKNTGAERVEIELAGWLENAVCLHSGQTREIQRRNRVVHRGGFIGLVCGAEPPPEPPAARRADIVFDDFERETHGDWTAAGEAFGNGPVALERIPPYQGQVGGQDRRVINSHATAPGGDVGAKDAATGMLTSRSFVIERNFITFLVGGGSHQGRTCVNLMVDDEPVLSATGRNDNRMAPATWDVRRWAGRTARIQVVDRESGGWGNIGLDQIVFTDQPRAAAGPLAEEPDFGTMVLALLEARSRKSEVAIGDRALAVEDWGCPEIASGDGSSPEPAKDGWLRSVFERSNPRDETAVAPSGRRLIGSITRRFSLEPGETAELDFVVAWHFTNLKMDRLPPGRHYGTRFGSALEVVEHVGRRYGELRDRTRLWHDTWYDSTLPYWFLDRTFLNLSVLATSTSYRFANGRFWGWEGVGCCHGTCGHVWQYAQAVARLFPELERDTRERVDFGLALQRDGAIHFRAEFNDIPAVDGQAGTVLRALREHQMTTDDSWLKRNWPGIRSAIEWLMAKDGDADGLIVGNQHNTLDTDWFGPVAWLSGMYLAALRAGEEMARVAGDASFARRCREIFDRGQPKLVAELFEGEYFINKPDPRHLDAINSGTGCHIDQVLGQSWAFQVGLGRILPERETVAALKSLWRYNFTPDVGPYREEYKPGRWYAMPGEGGLLMCSFPRADWDYAQAKGRGPDWAAGYFNECMNGFEYQAAGHMIAEGLVMEGLAVTRMVHDRYHATRRNPWNEIECGDHYARSMASYGVYLAACGYEYDGPRSRLAFAPRLNPEKFKCAFTTAEGWGSYSQSVDAGELRCLLEVKWGRVELGTLGVRSTGGTAGRTVAVKAGGESVPAQVERRGGAFEIRLGRPCRLEPGQSLEVILA
ncbi:MAG: hypothetical protein KJ072_18110 [Verrucomicrobia bacterium]|nr:hypothetical protein [Verrucomicrobiota bacterium]